MKRRMVLSVLAALVLVAAFCGRCPAADAKLQPNDYVAIIGDSITEQKLYSLFIEDYLLMCKPAPDLRATQFGWSGETAIGYSRRMANDTLRFHPTVATTCFGMNDGGYSPMNPDKARQYRESQQSVVQQLKKAGVRMIVVGSPGCVDSDTYRKNPDTAAMYNKTLAEERDIARKLAEEEGVVFANVFDPMMDVMAKAKAKYGKEYHLAGPDGVHPDRNGHLVMAYAFLKALGCDGDIGTITVDLAADKAEGTDGHKVLSCKRGVVEVESSRYPFCFAGNETRPAATRGVIEFFPFNEDLNRFKLVVKGASSQKLKVTWGESSKEFAAADLAKGINLAAEFLDNPFGDAFRTVESAIAKQQNMEVNLVKSQVHNLMDYQRMVPEEAQAFERVAEKLVARDKQARDESAAAVVPVKHTIKIEKVGN